MYLRFSFKNKYIPTVCTIHLKSFIICSMKYFLLYQCLIILFQRGDLSRYLGTNTYLQQLAIIIRNTLH
jgi:hypothetical protein